MRGLRRLATRLGDESGSLRMFLSLVLLNVVEQFIDGQMREIVFSPALIVESFPGHQCEEVQGLYGAEFVSQGLGGLFSYFWLMRYLAICSYFFNARRRRSSFGEIPP